MSRITRYQGAIVHDGHILLITHRELASGREYWVIPGGGIEAGETEEQCVVREMREETNLDVRVERVLLVMDDLAPNGIYQELKTFLCTPVGGEARPGYEPEAAAYYAIGQVKWFPLADEAQWGEMAADPITYPQLKAIRQVLGYDGRENRET